MAVKTHRLITSNDLSPTDFTIQNGKVHAVIQHTEYDVRMNTGWATHGALADGRARLTMRQGFGVLHLDVKRTSGTNSKVGELPAGTPTPAHLMEVQHGNATFYIDKGSRSINGTGITNNQRYIVNLVGFFNI